tara:strand:- start:9709 stop:10248 length:540 start_codon:yes stop_codon:yes gene_type:complete
MGYVDTQNAWFKTPAVFIVVVGLVFFIGYGLGVNTNPSESERVENLERTLFDSQGNQRVIESVSIVKDNSTHGHLKIEPSVGIGTIREIWVYRAVETSVQMPIQDLQNNISQQEPVITQLPIPFLGPVFLLEESFAPSPFTKVTSTFPVQIAEEDAFYVLIRFSDKDVEYVETFFVRQE